MTDRIDEMRARAYGGDVVGEPHYFLAPRELAELLDIAEALRDACQEFVRKVECGEARSKRSYAEMKAALAKLEPKP